MKFVLIFMLLLPLSSNCLAALPMLSSISAGNNLSLKGYKVKMITNDGVVFYVYVNTQTGRVNRYSR